MYLRSYEDVMEALKNIQSDSLIVAMNADPIKKIFIQRVSRTIDGKKILLITLRDIEICEEHQRQGIFRHVIELMEVSRTPILVDDIVNDIVLEFLLNRGYTAYYYNKRGDVVRAAYLKVKKEINHI